MLPFSLCNRLPSLAAVACTALLFGMATGAQAQVSNVAAIRVTQNDATYLQVAELQAFSGATNVAASSNGGTATGDAPGFSTTLGMGIDGNTDGNYGGASGSLYHSGGTSAGIYYQSTFASPTTIDTVALYGRSDCCQSRDNNLTISLLDSSGGTLFSRNVNLQPDVGQGFTTFAVPEPVGLPLVACGALALVRRRRR